MICAERLTLFDAKLRLIFRMHLLYEERTRKKERQSHQAGFASDCFFPSESRT